MNAPGPIRKPSLIERAAQAYDLEAALNQRAAEAVARADAAAPPAPAPPPIVEMASEPARTRRHAGGHPIDRALLAEAGCIDPAAPTGPLAEEYRVIKRGLLADAPVADEGFAVLVASAGTGEGKTFTAVNLALSLAGEPGVDVLLVDGDVLQPSVPARLGLPDGPGLVDLLRDGGDPESLVLGTDVPGLSVLRAGARAANVTELLASAKAARLFAALHRPGRVLVIDTPPVLAASPAPALARHADRVLLIVRADHTGERALREAVEALDGRDIRLLLNGAWAGAAVSRLGSYGDDGASAPNWKAPVAAAAGLAAVIAAPASAQERPRSFVQPYLEANAVVSAALGDDADTVTYAAVAAGVDAGVQTRRVRGQASYRYERRIELDGDLGDADIHSGLAAVQADVTRNLTLEGAALATRTRVDVPGPLPALDAVADDALGQVFAVTAGPTVNGRAGPVALSASYRLSYVAVGDGDDRVTAPGPDGRPVVTRRGYDDAVSHSLTASAGMAPGRLPFGWTVGAGYVREDADELDRRFEASFVRGDVVLPVSPTFALTAGVGYENIVGRQRDFVRDPGSGLPVLVNGRLVEAAGPRREIYDIDGLIYDAGFIWRPRRDTELQLRAGRRYGGTAVTGSLRHRIDRFSGVTANIYDGVSTFGRVLVTDLEGVPTDFRLGRNRLIGGGGGCVFGGDPGSGVCFDNALNSLAGANFRARGANAAYTRTRGVWSLGLGATYNRRDYLAPEGGGSLLFEDVDEENASLQGQLTRRLGRRSTLDFDAYLQWFRSDLLANDAYGLGASATYARAFTDRLTGQAGVGLFNTSFGDEDQTFLTGLVGVRYVF